MEDKKMLIEKSTRDLKLEIKDALETILKEYKKDSLDELEYIINSNMPHDKAIEMLQGTNNSAYGKMLGAIYMFNKMIDEDTRKELDSYIGIVQASISVDINTSYCKYIYRLDEIYKEV